MGDKTVHRLNLVRRNGEGRRCRSRRRNPPATENGNEYDDKRDQPDPARSNNEVRALELAVSDAERRFLGRRLAEVTSEES